MKHYTKRLLSVLLALSLLLTLLPVSALAAEPAAEVPITRADWLGRLVEAFSLTVEEGDEPDNYFSDLTGEEDYY